MISGARGDRPAWTLAPGEGPWVAVVRPENDIMLAVRRLAAADVPAVTAIVRGLPDYFTSDVAERVERDAAAHDAWVLTDAAAIAGFTVVARRPPGGAEILWIAIDPARRGRGLGTRLLDGMLEDLAAAGVSVVEAKTLDRSAGYPPYEATRAFWEHRGFVQLDTIDRSLAGSPATRRPSMLRPCGPPGDGHGCARPGHDGLAWLT